MWYLFFSGMQITYDVSTLTGSNMNLDRSFPSQITIGVDGCYGASKPSTYEAADASHAFSHHVESLHKTEPLSYPRKSQKISCEQTI